METQSSYLALIGELKSQILRSRYVAARLVNREMLLLYFAVGKRLSEKIAAEKWGAKVLEKISDDLQRELPGLRGFSHRNLYNMQRFAKEYQELSSYLLGPSESQNNESQLDTILQTTSAELNDFIRSVFLCIGFSHHVLLMNRCKNLAERRFYMEQAVAHQWSHEMLDYQISAHLYHRQGALPNNFETTLSDELKEKALSVFKDEYLLDFINIDPADERVLEKNIVDNIRRFVLTMGDGFAFIGSQYRLVVEEEEFFIDLLFYNRLLRCLVPIELKRGKFRPADPGQLNFYINVLNAQVRLPHENPSIGIVLCKDKNDTVVRFAVQGIENAIGVATYQISEEMPAALRRVLPDPEALRSLLENE
jgi:predicted nuclease of restriction endonuclease-like (RecB) superfamily